MNTSIRKYLLGRISQARILLSRQKRIISMQRSTIDTLRAQAKVRTKMIKELTRGV